MPRAGYRLEMLEREILLYHPDEPKVIYCNETAALVWRLCDGTRTVREIGDLLGRAFAQPADRLSDEVAGVIRALYSSRALTR
jgi:hypothetical protein